MNELDSHFDTICEIASAELDESNGCQLLCARLQTPFDSLALPQIETWVANLSVDLSKNCWGTHDFKSSCKTHGENLLYVAETGDVPQIINVGYPMMKVAHTFQNIEDLTQYSTILLPQLIENISSTQHNDPYFECTDLFHCYLDDFGLTMPEIDDIDNMDASRLLVDSVAIVAMIRSWRDLDPMPESSVHFCTSSGSCAFGRPIPIQPIAR